MPIAAYYGGHGEDVAKRMRKRYGKRWREVFYATANKRGVSADDRHKAMRAMVKR